MKKIIVTFIFIFAAGLLFTIIPKESKERIGIISAMDNEIDVLLKEADIKQIDSIGGVKYYIGKLRGKDVVITRAGIGKVRVSISKKNDVFL